MSERERVDVLLVLRGLARSRQNAQALILAGKVYSGDTRIEKAGHRMPVDTPLAVRGGLRYASRGGLKLEAVLDHFGIDPAGRRCLDVGASTGGFTDCLLQRGADRVHAVDVGYGQLAWKLRNHPRVVVHDRMNFRKAGPGDLPSDVDLAVVDVSFISLRHILPNLSRFLRPGGEAVLLVKPQFEAGREKVGKGGIVRDDHVRLETLEAILGESIRYGFSVLGTMECPVRGADGNVEYFAYLNKGDGEAEGEEGVD
ncbi:MAG: TlyA family RNA methyltransferase [bacterium]|nr:MAG: TlyA family RNA methyltransferase [bacterium]